MLIPLPILLWYSVLTGQPVVVTIHPGEAPKYETPAPKPPVNKSEADEYSIGCVSVICNA